MVKKKAGLAGYRENSVLILWALQQCEEYVFSNTNDDVPLLAKEVWQEISEDLTGSFQATLFRYAILKLLYTQGVDSLAISDLKKLTKKEKHSS